MKADAVGGDVKAAFTVAMTLAFIAALIDNGVVGWLVFPIVFGLVVFSMVRAPLRASLFVLMFLALVLENPSENPANGKWHSPWWDLGALMLMHLKNTVGGGLFFSGMDVMLVILGVIATLRSSSGSRIDRIGNFRSPPLLIRLAQLSLLTIVFAFIVGFVRGGGDTSMAVWQIDRVIYLPVLFLLFQTGLRGEEDVRSLAKVVLAAAVVRSLQAIYVRHTIILPPNPITWEPGLPFATTHHDSILFAAASVILCVMLIQRIPKSKWIVLCLSPIYIAGMLANNRRMVWVQLMLVLLTVYFVTGPNAVKRKIQNALKVLVPVAAIYLFVGWGNSNSRIFKPVAMIRSAVDSKTDSSTQWRDVENFDLIATVKQYPIFGAGYGQHFFEVIKLPPVDYDLELYLPHNSLLGLWTFYGYLGYMGMTSLWVAGVYCAMRAYPRLNTVDGKAAALVSVGAIQIYYVQCYGDMGLGSWTGVFIVAPAIATAAKLVVSSGAWAGAEPAKGRSVQFNRDAQAPHVHVGK